MALSLAGYNRLVEAPEDWAEMPMFGDSRPNGPLERDGHIEVRRIPTKTDGPISWVRVEWRITQLGRDAMLKKIDQMGYTLVDGELVSKTSLDPGPKN